VKREATPLSSQNAHRITLPTARTVPMLMISATGRFWRPALFVPAGVLLGSLLMAALPAQAHHVLEVTALQPTPWHGLLSGLAHPVLGPDHLVFLVVLALLGLRQRRRWVLALLGVALLGAAAGLMVPGLPGAELILAATVGVEALVLVGWLPAAVLLPATALHGYVLSASVLGWSTMPIATYLLGLLLSQGFVVLASLALLRPLSERLRHSASQRRWLALALMGMAGALAVVAERG
jgi:urease accessory protein